MIKISAVCTNQC